MDNYEIKKVKSGWAIYLGDEEIASISREEYITLRLYEKDNFNQMEIDTIMGFANNRKAKKIALENNIYRNKSCKELVNKLSQKGIDEELAIETVQHMLANGEIDEMDIIRRFIRDRLKFNPRSKRFLKYELIKKGFKDLDVEFIIEGLSLCDEDIARNLLNQRKRSLRTPEAILKYLKNKGFDYHTIKKVTEIINEDID